MAEQKGIVRMGDRDVMGNVPISHALTHVKGVSFMFANAVCNVLNLDKNQKIGLMTADEIKKIEDCMHNPSKYNIPAWLLNQRKDMDTGEDLHLISNDLVLKQKLNIRMMQKIKCYKGIRHSIGSKKVRGQRTKSSGRKGKTMGVQRRKNAKKGK